MQGLFVVIHLRKKQKLCKLIRLLNLLDLLVSSELLHEFKVLFLSKSLVFKVFNHNGRFFGQNLESIDLGTFQKGGEFWVYIESNFETIDVACPKVGMEIQFCLAICVQNQLNVTFLESKSNILN